MTAGETRAATVTMTVMIAIATMGITTTGITTTATTATGTTTVMAIMIVTTAIAAMTGIEIAAGETAMIGGAATTATDGIGTMMATGVNPQNGGMDSETPSAIFLLRL